MPKTIAREDLLRTLELIRAGTTPKDVSEQSSCVVFQNGYAHSYNEDVYCRAKSNLPQEWSAAIPLPPLLTILTKLAEQEVTLDLTKTELIIAGKGRKTGIRAESQISMPFDSVTLPVKADWQKISTHFSDAIALVQDCAGTDTDEFAMTCIHITPKFVEATDRTSQMARHNVQIGIPEPVLLKRDSISPSAALAPKRVAVTDNWFHLRTAAGSLYSVRKNEGGYPDLGAAFEVKGRKVVLPKGLKEASDKAEIFSSEDKDNNNVMITLESGRVKLKGQGESGWHRENKKISYAGPNMSFLISPRLLREILDRNNECHIQDDRLIVSGNKWVYASILVKNGDSE